MDKFVARANIEHYRRKLAQETDETKRQVLARLLAEEEAKLEALTDDPQKSGLMMSDPTAASVLGARQFAGRFLRRSIRGAPAGMGTQARAGRRGP
jgi:hypothetical protein